MPLINHVPVKEPINNKIIIAEVVELMLLLIVSMIFNQFFPWRTPIRLASAADNNNAIWLGPLSELSP